MCPTVHILYCDILIILVEGKDIREILVIFSLSQQENFFVLKNLISFFFFLTDNKTHVRACVKPSSLFCFETSDISILLKYYNYSTLVLVSDLTFIFTLCAYSQNIQSK